MTKQRLFCWGTLIGASLALTATPAGAQYELGLGVGAVAPLGTANAQRSGRYEFGLTAIGPAPGAIQGRFDLYRFHLRGRVLQTPSGPLQVSDLEITTASIGFHFTEPGPQGPFLGIGVGVASLAVMGEANDETAPMTGLVIGARTTFGKTRIAVELGGELAFTQTGSGSNDTLGTLRWVFGRVRVARLF